VNPNKSIFRRLVQMALPVIGLNLLAVLALAIDTAMCGHLPNADLALKSLGYATQIVFLLMVLMMGVSVGAVALVARAYGASLHERVNHVLHQATMLTVILGAIMGALGVLTAPLLLSALGATAEVQGLALAFLGPLLGCIVFNYLNLLYAAILRGVGNTRLAFLIALAATAINVLVNYGLILGRFGLPALGVAGAAWGTVLAQLFSVCAMIIAINRGAVPGLRLPLRIRPIDMPLARELWNVGAPAALDMVILNAAFMSIVGMLGRIDESAVAAHGVGTRIQALAFVPGFGVSQATGAMIGQALGAKDAARAREILRAGLMLCASLMTVLGAVILVFAVPLVRLFDIDPDGSVGSYSLLWMRVLGYSMPIFGIHIGFVGLLQGSGATRLSLMINFTTSIFIQVPLSWFLGFPLHLAAFGVWLAFPLTFVVKALLELWVYRRGSWARLGAQLT
jgi:multidrug resistance protein, MATE family